MRTSNIERPTSNADLLIAEARSWIGTPFMHAARVKSVGIDCGGLVMASARAVGLRFIDTTNYSTECSRGDSENLVKGILLFCDEIPITERQPGDILLFRARSLPLHMAVLVSDTLFVHAYQSAGKACETELGPVWMRLLSGVYRFREGVCQL
jgi:NlpC/P60 family putative phage cell wall peptidase